MADTINKPSIQIRSGLPSPLPDKSPSPATKLLISHGKPNFTIARSPSTKDNGNPLSPQPNANNNYNAYKSANTTTVNNNSSSFISNTNKFVVGTKFNGVFKPSNASATWATTNGNATATATANGNGNGNATATTEQNEAAKVVLRRPKPVDVEPVAQGEDENVPEFILRQRRIQERLAKENVLDFENRRSGYFTHVMISPDSPNRTSFVETMASPAIVPALEMPLPAKIEEEPQPATNGHSEAAAEAETEAETVEVVAAEAVAVAVTAAEIAVESSNGHIEEPEVQPVSNGHVASDDVAPEEVAKAIEEVNKAVAGEDDDTKPEAEPITETKSEVESVVPAAVEAQVEVITPVAAAEPVSPPVQNGDAVPVAAAAESNGHTEDITISHTNGDVPSIATPDPSGALGVNYEPKTVVSFSQELGGGENNYPDTVKVLKDAPASAADAELQELAKLKFDIKSDAQDEVQVTPVLRAE
ncbi:uncharacterized protein LOC132790405 [Drosophila nasuta]|uniref:uncharacterized protein LOC132790405 n=1 Tax=Drosophila nasuta TaxID=42062 RepID=UPI00295F4064|nr:uncharacterized protein LOC132790405 [Drosophila nasuta]XP_060654889.1 uncharacterized protein LOC132790405 [Drosophila nasuta]